MLTAILAALHLDQPDSLKRALAALLTPPAVILVPIINSTVLVKIGVVLTPEQVTAGMYAVAGVLSTYIFQSGAKAAVVAHADAVAAQPVPIVDAAKAALEAAAQAGAQK